MRIFGVGLWGNTTQWRRMQKKKYTFFMYEEKKICLDCSFITTHCIVDGLERWDMEMGV